jgi:hypothetical protein
MAVATSPLALNFQVSAKIVIVVAARSGEAKCRSRGDRQIDAAGALSKISERSLSGSSPNLAAYRNEGLAPAAPEAIRDHLVQASPVKFPNRSGHRSNRPATERAPLCRWKCSPHLTTKPAQLDSQLAATITVTAMPSR